MHMPPHSAVVRVLARADRLVGKLEALILSWGILIMAANTIANVCGRYIFHRSICFSEELNEFLIVFVTFMGLGYVTRKGIHIRISVVYDLLPQRFRKAMMIIISATTAVMMGILAWYAFEYVQKVAIRGRVTPALQLPLYLTYIWVIIGLFLAALQYFLTALRNLDFEDERVFISYTETESYDDLKLLTEAGLDREEAGAEQAGAEQASSEDSKSKTETKS